MNLPLPFFVNKHKLSGRHYLVCECHSITERVLLCRKFSKLHFLWSSSSQQDQLAGYSGWWMVSALLQLRLRSNITVPSFPAGGIALNS